MPCRRSAQGLTGADCVNPPRRACQKLFRHRPPRRRVAIRLSAQREWLWLPTGASSSAYPRQLRCHRRCTLGGHRVARHVQPEPHAAEAEQDDAGADEGIEASWPSPQGLRRLNPPPSNWRHACFDGSQSEADPAENGAFHALQSFARKSPVHLPELLDVAGHREMGRVGDDSF